MTAETFKYLLIGLFSFVILGSFYLVFKSGFKLEKRKDDQPLFGAKAKEEKRGAFKSEVLIGGTFVLFLFLFDKCST